MSENGADVPQPIIAKENPVLKPATARLDSIETDSPDNLPQVNQPIQPEAATNKVLVGTAGGSKIEMTPAQADAEANAALQAEQAKVADIPGAKAWMEDSGSGTRRVKVYVPDQYRDIYESRK